jgi:anti-sigma factor RsiW
MSHITENHEALLDYLYEEGDPAARLAIAKHLQECAACSVAVLEFQNVRGMLSDWTPPASASVSAPLNHRARPGWLPGSGSATYHEKLTGPRSRALLQAAAAILLFVSGMAASQLRFENGLLTFGTAAPPAADIRSVSSSTPVQPAADIDEIVRRVRAELAREPAPAVDSERLLQQVRSMIGESEQRQHRELALRLSQVAGEVDAQHRVDVERMQQDFGKQQEATMEYLVRTSGGLK